MQPGKKAVLLDMYGVIVKQTGDDFVPYIQKTFPHLTEKEIYTPWLKADIGEMTSLEVWAALGFQGDLKKNRKTISGYHTIKRRLFRIYKSHKTAVQTSDYIQRFQPVEPVFAREVPVKPIF